MSDWDSYLDPTAAAQAAADPNLAAAADALGDAGTDLGNADAAADWANWHGEIAADNAVDAQSYVDHAQQNFDAGFVDAGLADLAAASVLYDSAADSATAAGDSAETAAGWDAYASQDLAVAADATWDAGAYDASAAATDASDLAYDASAAGTDAAAAYDASADAGYDASTSSYDASSSYDTTSYDAEA